MFKHLGLTSIKNPEILLGVLVCVCELIIGLNSLDNHIDVIKFNKPGTYNIENCHSIEGCEPGWIDPFDMFGEERYPANANNKFESENSNTIAPRPGWKDPFRSEGESQNPRSLNVILYQRLINVLLRATGLEESSVLSTIVNLELTIMGEDLKVLQHFGKHGEKAASVQKVSDIINDIFYQSQRQSNSFTWSVEKAWTWLSKSVVKILRSPEWTVISSVALMLTAMLWLVFTTKSYQLAMVTVFIMIFFTGFGFTWIRLYEEKEIEKYYDKIVHGNAPYHCTGQPLVWYELIYYKFFGEDCLKFYKRRDVPAIVKVSPTEVLAVTLSTMIIEPAQKIGIAYGRFVTGIIKELPWYIKPLALPLAFILPPIFIIVLLAFFFNYHLSFSVTGIHLMPSWTVRKQKDKYIEDIPNKSSENCVQKGVFEKVLSGCKEPLILWMNLPAFKSLSSNTAGDVGTVNDNKSDVASNTSETKIADKDNNTGNEDTKEGAAAILCEGCVRRTRSIYTSREGGSVDLSSKERGVSVSGCSDIKDLSEPSFGQFGAADDHNNSSTGTNVQNLVKKK